MFVISSAWAEDTEFKLGIEMSAPVVSEPIDVRMKLYVDRPFSRRLGLTVFALASSEYGQLYAGPAVYVGDFTFDISLGVETDEFPLRAATSGAWSAEHAEVLYMLEYGGSGYWYKALATRSFNLLVFGLFSQRYDGSGPLIGLSSHRFDLWAAPVYDFEDDSISIVAGLDGTF